MGSQEVFFINTHLGLVNMGSVNVGSVNGSFHRKLVMSVTSLWSFVSTLFLVLFGFFNRTIIRVKGDNSCHKNKPDGLEPVSNGEEQRDVVAEEPEVDVDASEVEDIKGNDDINEEESPKFFFKFQFQTYRENCESIEDSPSVPSANTNKYEFYSGNDFSHYLEKPQVVSLTVKELYADSINGVIGNEDNTEEAKLIADSIEGIIKDNLVEPIAEAEQKAKAEAVHEEEERGEDCAESAYKEEMNEKLEEETFIDKDSISRKGKAVEVENNEDVSRERNFIASDSDSDSSVSGHEFMTPFVVSTSDGLLSDIDFDGAFELDNLTDTNGEKVELSDEDFELEDINLENLSTGYEAEDFDDEDSDIMEELKNIEESNMENPENIDCEKLSAKHLQENKSSDQEKLSSNDNHVKGGVENSEKSNSSKWESDDSNELETLWEHQELIEQLKMELKKVRATGLPTILEEDECPKIMEDLKPWKIDEKFQHEDRMSELHKFYRSYRERMRKFDILNYQKMYALGFLQSKDPLESISSHKGSAPAFTSLFSQKFLTGKRRKSGSDPMMKFIKELHGDLEMVYVGQTCLSWEILHWQYEKALELWDSDPYGLRSYNEVAGEFQQFQVLMQRFIENEPFEGPRLQNYIKNRCVLRNLLQVPVIREDGLKDKKGRRKAKDDDTITSDKLVEIMEESIRIFWRFIRADKDAHNVIQKGRKGTQIEPQDPSELELLIEVRTSLLKKEKKLKEILRSGNCILRKFQKHQDENSDHVLYFFSQVDMKLVARVLNMSKITMDQLLWCRGKLSKINFVSRKIHVEQSFSLFPC